MKEAVNHPAHYGGEDNAYEAIKVIEAWGLDFLLGNTVKYIARAGKKDCELQDLKKAKFYLERTITKYTARPENNEDELLDLKNAMDYLERKIAKLEAATKDKAKDNFLTRPY
ncbi:SaV-like [Spirosomataceae bacterium]|jgi:hypothetical protein